MEDDHHFKDLLSRPFCDDIVNACIPILFVGGLFLFLCFLFVVGLFGCGTKELFVGAPAEATAKDEAVDVAGVDERG